MIEGLVALCLLASPPWATPSTLRNHVIDVIGLSAEEQMLRVDTGRVVASVKDAKAIGNGAYGQFVRHPMSQEDSAFFRAGTDEAVTVGVSQACPQDASSLSGASDITTKADFKRNGLPFLLALLGTKSPTSKFYLAGVVPEKKRTAARFANVVSRTDWICTHAESLHFGLQERRGGAIASPL